MSKPLTRADMYRGLDTAYMIVEIPTVVYTAINEAAEIANELGQIDMSEEAFAGGILCNGVEQLRKLNGDPSLIEKMLSPVDDEDPLVVWLNSKIAYHHKAQIEAYVYNKSLVQSQEEAQRHGELKDIYSGVLMKFVERGRL